MLAVEKKMSLSKGTIHELQGNIIDGCHFNVIFTRLRLDSISQAHINLYESNASDISTFTT